MHRSKIRPSYFNILPGNTHFLIEIIKANVPFYQ